MKRMLIAFTIMLGLLGPLFAEEVKIEANRDVWLSSYTAKGGKVSERDDNMGAATTIKLKIWQEFGIVDFDCSVLKGQVIKNAWLYVKPTGEHKYGKMNTVSDILWLTISSVSHDWVEGKSADYAKDTVGFGATFNESSHTKADWGWEHSRVWDVILGNGNTIRFDGRTEPEGDWLKMKIDPRIVQALTVGASHGIFLFDGSGDWTMDNRISTREGEAAPYLLIETEGQDKLAPRVPDDLRVVPAPNEASNDRGAVLVSLTVPQDAFAYHVKIGDKQIERWQLPFAAMPGTKQSFAITDLDPSAELTLKLTIVDRAGNVSASVTKTITSSPVLTVPKLPEPAFKAPGGGDLPLLGGVNAWAFPEITKIDPVTGAVMYEEKDENFKSANAVWDAGKKLIRLAAARGEILSFQIALEGETDGVSLSLSDLQGPYNALIPKSGVKMFRNWYVGRDSEYAIPLTADDSVACPMQDNEIEGQTLQAVTIDYHVPADTRAGDYAGAVLLTSGEQTLELELKVKVYNVTIPDEINFNPELNCYSGPGQAGSEKFKDSYRLAHYHRATINRVPYSQTGRRHEDWTPPADQTGRVTDWTEFDNNLGGLMDGSWFEDNPRKGIPVPTVYLPLFEGYPLNFREYYDAGDAPMVTIEGRKDEDKQHETMVRHYGMAPPIEHCFDPAYRRAWIQCVADFYAHFKQKGWTRTMAQCYLNNKPNYGYTLWTLDEPTRPIDWRALNYFGEMWKEAIQDPEVYTRQWHEDLYVKGLAAMDRDRPTFLYRGDISRMPWQGSMSDGIMNIIYLGGGGIKAPKITRDSKYRLPSIMYAYGSANEVNTSNLQSAAWCLKSFCNNLDGVLPWQSLGGAGSLTKANKTSLIIDTGDKFGHAIGSFRLHAMRRGAQDCELLRLLQLSRGWSREHIAKLIQQKVVLFTQYTQKFDDEAASMTFKALTSNRLTEMKEGILILLEGSPEVK